MANKEHYVLQIKDGVPSLQGPFVSPEARDNTARQLEAAPDYHSDLGDSLFKLDVQVLLSYREWRVVPSETSARVEVHPYIEGA